MSLEDLRCISPKELLPHSGERVLIKRVTNLSGESITCETEVLSGHGVPSRPGTIDAMACIEYVAQTGALLDAVGSRGEGGPRGGVLVRVRDFSLHCGALNIGDLLTVTASYEAPKGEIAQIRGAVYRANDGIELASGTLTLRKAVNKS